MEQDRAKVKNEVNLNEEGILQGDYNHSLLQNEDTSVVGGQKDIVTPVETSSETAVSEIRSTDASNIHSHASDSTVSISSRPVEDVSAILSSKVNERSTVDSCSPQGNQISQKSPTGIEKENSSESIEETQFSESNISSNIKSGDDQIQSDETNSKNTSKVNRGNNHNCVSLTVTDVESSENQESFSHDMELVNLEEYENTESDSQYYEQTGARQLMSHSKSDIELSSEERKAELYKYTQIQLQGKNSIKHDSSIDAFKSSISSSESYNDFHYWRQPMASLDIEDGSAMITVKQFKDSKIKEDCSEIKKFNVDRDDTTQFELDDEVDDQVVLASLTGMNTRSVVDERKPESKSVNLEDLDDLDEVKNDEKLNEVEIVDLKASSTLEGDGIELLADSITDPCEDSVENSSADEDLQAALKEQLKISTQSSDLITETENFLANVKAEVSTADYRDLSDDTSSNKGKHLRLLIIDTTSKW